MSQKLDDDVNESIEQHNLRLAEEESLRRREEQGFKYNVKKLLIDPIKKAFN